MTRYENVIFDIYQRIENLKKHEITSRDTNINARIDASNNSIYCNSCFNNFIVAEEDRNKLKQAKR